MRYNQNAAARWDELNNKRRGLLTRCEKYSAYTIRKVCPADGYSENNTEQQHDYQSVGAQAVRHLVSKLMLALFAPSRPAMRLELGEQLKQQMAQGNMSEEDIQDSLAKAEREAWKGIDREAGMRPALYEIITHLVVVGNVLQDTSGDTMQAIPLKDYVVKRNKQGKVIEIITRDCVEFDELEDDVQALIPNKQPDDKVTFYRWVQLVDGKYVMTSWVDKQILPRKYVSKWPEDKLPLRPLTWDLSHGNNYGTGLVEDYQGDFGSLSMLSESLVTSAILASEFRWLANPAGMTKPEDMENSENGAVLPGQEGDLSVINSGTAGAVPHIQAVASDYINRIGRGFLLASAVTRNAERVTAEEIRMQAQELETSLGGAYSRIAVDMQVPLAYYLLRKVGFVLNGKAITPTIVTGLDALSRASDLDNLKLFLGDLAMVGSLPPNIQGMLQLGRVIKNLAAGRGLSASDYVSAGDGPPPPDPEAEATPPTQPEPGVTQ